MDPLLDPTTPPAPGPAGPRWLHVTVVAVALGGLTWFVVAERDQVRRALSLIRHLRLDWMTVGLVASVASIALFAAVRVVLLAAGGARLPLGRAVGASFASGALAATLPAGGAIATAYMVQRYREVGAGSGLAAWTTVATGVVAPVVLVFMTLLGFAIAGEGSATVIVPSAVALVLLGGFFAISRRPQVLQRPTAWIVHQWRRVRTRGHAQGPVADSATAAAEFVDQFGAVRAGPGRWSAAWALQVVSWAGEFVTLVCSILAVGGTVPWGVVLAVYGTSQLAGALPLIPGGAGQVEAALVVGLTAAGMDTATALAAAVVFRLASHWLVVPVGWVCFALLRRPRPTAAT